RVIAGVGGGTDATLPLAEGIPVVAGAADAAVAAALGHGVSVHLRGPRAIGADGGLLRGAGQALPATAGTQAGLRGIKAILMLRRARPTGRIGGTAHRC